MQDRCHCSSSGHESNFRAVCVIVIISKENWDGGVKLSRLTHLVGVYSQLGGKTPSKSCQWSMYSSPLKWRIGTNKIHFSRLSNRYIRVSQPPNHDRVTVYTMASQIPGVKDAIGSPVTNLPTPSLIIQRHILEQNISKLHRDVSKLGIDFRPHVKTLKASLQAHAPSFEAFLTSWFRA